MEHPEKFSSLTVSEVELIYRPSIKAGDRPKVSCSRQAYQIFLSSWNQDKIELQEQFKVLLLSSSQRVLGIYECSTGGLSATIADVRLIFAAALKARATKIMLCHNHPNGELKHSDPDKKITEKLQDAGRILEIEILDHIIITSAGYYSFADQGLL